MNRCPYDSQVMLRSLVKRSENINNLQSGYRLSIPELLQSEIAYEHSKKMSFGLEELTTDEIYGDNVKATHTCRN